MTSARLGIRVAVIAAFALLVINQAASNRRMNQLEHEVARLQAEIRSNRLAEAPKVDAAPVRLAEVAAPIMTMSAATAVELSRGAVSAPRAAGQARPPFVVAGRFEEDLEILSEEELEKVFAGGGPPMPGIASGPALEAAAPAEIAAQRPLQRLEKGGVLLPKGRTQIEPTVSYSHISNNRVGLSGFSVFDVVFIGEINAEEVDRDIVAPSVTVRQGLGRSLQAEVEVPLRYQREESLSGPVDDRQTSVESSFGLSDVGTGLFYQFMREHGSWPSMIALFKAKAPTGSSPLGSETWSTKGGLVMVKSSDPVALFSNVGYTVNWEGDRAGVRVNPGNSLEISAGLAYALNYSLSMNASVEQIFVGQSVFNGVESPGSRLVVGNFKTGLTYAINKQLSLEVGVGTGLTEDSPDLTVTVSLPYTF